MEYGKEKVPKNKNRKNVRNIYANFRKRFKSVYFRNLFFIATKSTTHSKFEATMNEVKEINTLACDHPMVWNPHIWSKEYSTLTRMHMQIFTMVYLKHVSNILYIFLITTTDLP